MALCIRPSGPRASFNAVRAVALGQRSLSTTVIRQAPAPARPGPQPTPSQQDADMWKSYTHALQTKFFGNLDPKTEAFYAAPLSSMGIPAGNNIAPEITNKAVYTIGDTLMDLKTPVFGAGSQKYSQRINRLLGAVKLKNNTDMGAQKRLNDAKAKSAKLQQALLDLQPKVREAYTGDPDKGTMTFRQWVPQNYPTYFSLSQEVQAASNTEASLRSQLEGPGADQLNRYKQNSSNSLDEFNPYTGLNMPVVDVAADVINGTQTLDAAITRTYKPTYSIDASYKDTVENWIANASDEDKKMSLSYNLSEAKSTEWQQFGLTEVQASANASYAVFFRVQYYVNTQLKEEHITAQEAGGDLSVQLTATDIGTFSITPGAWDIPNITEMYPRFETNAEMKLGPAARVDQVVLGYKVGMNVSMSAKLAERVKDLTSKAISSGGGISLFGYNVGFGAGGSGSSSSSTLAESITKNSSATTLSVPGKDFGYPVLLGVKGKKLPGVTAGKV